jgi:aspartyl-tRNA synthetase
MLRTHDCGELRASHIGQKVTLTGWVHSRRDHGGVIFVDLRDREGLTQIVFNPEQNIEVATQAHALRDEYVIQVTGEVAARLPGTENTKLPTGAIEIVAKELNILNTASTPPFPIHEEIENEDLRLRYRYLDLRRANMLYNLRLRSQVAAIIRHYMEEQKFWEVETPTLFKSTPEGAREFLVPSRMNPGKFYALPQSPQQFKQILMVSGIERYYQLARCYRDEDLRADRQPEFTQVDIEMSFIDREDIFALIEGMLAKIWEVALGRKIHTPFKRLTFYDAMNRYGSDKPDTRFGIEIVDITETFCNSSFKVFRSAIEAGGVIKALNAKALADVTTGEIEKMTEYAKSLGAKGLAFIKVEGGEWKSPIVKFFSETEKAALQNKLNIEEGDLILFAADTWLNACEILGRIRLYTLELYKIRNKLTPSSDHFNFLWVVDFPLLSFDRDQNRWYSSHHPFTAPLSEDIPLLDTNPKEVRGQHYDIVLNGVELGGGSIRIHQADVQQKIFRDILKIPEDVIEARFGYMLEAFRFGCPPHGGIALGFDRLIAILCGEKSIRDVIAFPKNNRGIDLMTQSPAAVDPKQLRDLGLSLKS